MKTDLPKFSKRKNKWTLMFISDDSQIKIFKHYRLLAYLWIFFLFIAISADSILFVLYEIKQHENIGLQNTLNSSTQRIKILENEKELLLARVAIAESDAGKDLPKIPAKKENLKKEESATKNEEPKTSEEKPIEAPAAVDSADKSNPDSVKNEPKNPPASNLISIENFEVNRKMIQFNIRNIDTKTDRLSGNIVVVLKTNKNDYQNWLSVPSVELVSGRPTGKNGEAFSIAKFKSVKLDAEISSKKFKTATVFIFSESGELMLEKDYPID